MHLYIALSTSPTPRHAAAPYHWALVTSPGPGAPTGLVNLYQITASPDTGQWLLGHDRLRLSTLPNLVGLVCLSTAVRERPAHVDAFIREFPAAQGRYRTDGVARWSCARWIMRCLEGLVEAGVVELDIKGLYGAVVARGVQLERETAPGEGVRIVEL